MSNDLIVFTSNKNGINCTTSVQTAEMFDRRHGNIIRQIDLLLEEEILTDSLCESVEYKDAKGEMRPMYLLTDVGFAILTMSLKLDSEKDKSTRREILQRFGEYTIRLVSENRRLTDKKDKASLPKNKSLNPEIATREFGWILKSNEKGHYKRVLIKDHIELDLCYGEIAHYESIIDGYHDSINEIYIRIKEIIEEGMEA